MAAETAGADLIRTEFRGLDALDLPAVRPAPTARRIARAVWPKLLAILIVLGAWQLVVMAGIWPPYLLPGPVAVFTELANQLAEGTLTAAIVVTPPAGGRRVRAGGARSGRCSGSSFRGPRLLRDAIGSLITGLQTMPSIAWFPLAILLFQLSETAILFVVVLGAAPSVANGVIHGIDHVPPLLLRAGRVLGARGFAAYRYVILPAALPSFVAGLKQGWAFAWRSLMAGELLVIVASQPSIGVRLSTPGSSWMRRR